MIQFSDRAAWEVAFGEVTVDPLDYPGDYAVPASGGYLEFGGSDAYPVRPWPADPHPGGWPTEWTFAFAEPAHEGTAGLYGGLLLGDSDAQLVMRGQIRALAFDLSGSDLTIRINETGESFATSAGFVGFVSDREFWCVELHGGPFALDDVSWQVVPEPGTGGDTRSWPRCDGERQK
jgi:hypothetical protein